MNYSYCDSCRWMAYGERVLSCWSCVMGYGRTPHTPQGQMALPEGKLVEIGQFAEG